MGSCLSSGENLSRSSSSRFGRKSPSSRESDIEELSSPVGSSDVILKPAHDAAVSISMTVDSRYGLNRKIRSEDLRENMHIDQFSRGSTRVASMMTNEFGRRVAQLGSRGQVSSISSHHGYDFSKPIPMDHDDCSDESDGGILRPRDQDGSRKVQRLVGGIHSLSLPRRVTSEGVLIRQPGIAEVSNSKVVVHGNELKGSHHGQMEAASIAGPVIGQDMFEKKPSSDAVQSFPSGLGSLKSNSQQQSSLDWSAKMHILEKFGMFDLHHSSSPGPIHHQSDAVVAQVDTSRPEQDFTGIVPPDGEITRPSFTNSNVSFSAVDRLLSPSANNRPSAEQISALFSSYGVPVKNDELNYNAQPASMTRSSSINFSANGGVRLTRHRLDDFDLVQQTFFSNHQSIDSGGSPVAQPLASSRGIDSRFNTITSGPVSVTPRISETVSYPLDDSRGKYLTDLYCRVDSWLRDNELMQSLRRADLFGEDEHDIHFDNPTPSVIWSESSRSSSTTGTGGPLCQPRPPSDSAAAPSNFALPSSNSNCFLSVDSGTPSTLVPSSTSSALALQRSSSSHAHDVLRDVEHSAVFVPVFCP